VGGGGLEADHHGDPGGEGERVDGRARDDGGEADAAVDADPVEGAERRDLGDGAGEPVLGAGDARGAGRLEEQVLRPEADERLVAQERANEAAE